MEVPTSGGGNVGASCVIYRPGVGVQRVERRHEGTGQGTGQAVAVSGLDKADVRALRGGEERREGGARVVAAAADAAVMTVAVIASTSTAASPGAAPRPSSTAPAAAAVVIVRATAAPTTAPAPAAHSSSSFATAAATTAACEPVMQPRQPRRRDSCCQLLIRLAGRRRLNEPRHNELRKPTRVLDVDAPKEVPNLASQTSVAIKVPSSAATSATATARRLHPVP